MELPKLREDLKLFEGTSMSSGYPTWNLYDPNNGQYYRLGWLQYQILSKWSCKSVEEVIVSINSNTTLSACVEDVEELIKFLDSNGLLAVSDDNAAAILLEKHESNKVSIIKRFIRNYLFFRVKLLQPDKFLKATLPFVKPFFTSTSLTIFSIIGVLGIYFAGREWDHFIHTFVTFFNFKGLLFFAITLTIVKLIHELGHAYTAKHYGCRIPAMGVAFLLFWPILYTDTTDAWRLKDRNKRLAIGAAGMIAELGVAALALFTWNFLPDGTFRNVIFFVATVSWMITLAINLNPFMRFDGYYILSDWLNIGNLQYYSFSLGKWYLRELLFGFGEPPPYSFSKGIHKFLIIFCFLTWIYRLVLTFTIAILIYFYFFKLLGILLMFTALWMMLVKPLAKEIREYWDRRNKVRFNKNTFVTMLVILTVTILVTIPWYSHISAPAVLEYQQHTKIYAPLAAKLKSINVYDGIKVTEDQVLFLFESADFDYQQTQLEIDIKTLQWRIDNEITGEDEFGYLETHTEDLATKKSEYQALLEQKKKLVIHAPFSGKVVYYDKYLNVDSYVAKDELLAELADDHTEIITTYIDENNIKRIKVGDKATFVPSNDIGGEPIEVRVVTIDQSRTKKMTTPYLISTYGGDIEVLQDGQGNYIPQQTLYRVVLSLTKNNHIYTHEIKGNVIILGEPTVIIRKIWLAVNKVLIRESGL